MAIDPVRFSNILLDWYQQNKRDLSWRHTRDPYKIWVSEIMLQQTQVNRVEEFYSRFLKRFPNIKSLAQASWPEVLEYWRGLGYYRRARNLHQAAKIIFQKNKGKFPQTFEDILELPGVGSYTAGAVASFAFDERVPALDTNAEAVFEHVFGTLFWRKLKPAQKFSFVQSFIPKNKAADFNHAVMDFGSYLKSLKIHQDCPFQHYCSRALQKRNFSKNLKNNSEEHQLKAQASSSVIKVAAGVLIHKGKVLIAERKKSGPLGGFWEFPGGKLEKNEDQRTCLKREMKEELGIEVSVRPAFYKMLTQYQNQTYNISFHRCSLLYGKPKALHVAKFEWITPDQFQNYKFLPANRKVIEILQKKKAMFRV